jgi:hypothetical protein
VVITDTARAWFFYSVYTTRNGLFGDNFTLGNLTAVRYHRMPIDDDNMRFDPYPDPKQGYEFFFIVDTFISGDDKFYLILNEF